MNNKAMEFAVPEYMQALLQASGQGLDALSYALADYLKLPVLISTSAYELISTSFFCGDCDCFIIESKSQIEDHEYFFLCNINAGSMQGKAVGRAIAPTGRITGYIFFYINQDATGLIQYKPIIDYAASLCCVHLQNRLELKQVQYRLKNDFLYDLLYGNLKQNEEIIKKGELWGWNFRLPHNVLVFQYPDLEPHSQHQHLLEVLLHVIENILRNKYELTPIIMVKLNELIIFLPPKINKGGTKEVLELINVIFSNPVTSEQKNLVTCGVGLIYANATELFRSYQEAKVSYEMGKLLKNNVAFFSNLGLERILFKHDIQDLKEYFKHVLGELYKHDDSENSLVNTLEVYSSNQFDMNKTAQAMFLHRNTLRYRLHKIEDILGCSFYDYNTRLDIVAAFKIKSLHKIDELLNEG